jgi:hypothetical protein
MDLISKKQGPASGTGSRETISTFFRSMQRELDTLNKQNLLISGPAQSVVTSGQDGLKKREVEGDSCDVNASQAKRPKY